MRLGGSECSSFEAEVAACEQRRGPFAWTCTDGELPPVREWKACGDGEINRGDDVHECVCVV